MSTHADKALQTNLHQQNQHETLSIINSAP